MATTNQIHSVTVALRAGVSDATLPNNVKMRSGKSYAISLEDWGKISAGARESVVGEPTFNVKPWIVPAYNGADYVLDLDTINNYSTIALLNADAQALGGASASGTNVGKYYLGQVVRGFNDAAFKLVKVTSGSATVALGSTVVWGGNATSTTYQTAKTQSLVTSDVSDVTTPVFAGVAIGTITAGQYGWIQIAGVATAKVLAQTDAGDPLKVSTTDENLTGVENEVQTLTLTSWDSGDTIKLTYNAVESGAITYNATPATNAAAFQAALEALAAFAPGDVVVTATDIDHYVFTFGGAFASTDVGALTATSGTGSAAGTFAETNKGSGDTAVGDVVATARTAADTGTALAEIRSPLARNLRSRARDIFSSARN